MQKRELKDAIEELSNNLVNRINIVTQELLTLDKNEKGEFLKRNRFDSEFDLPRSLFYVILKKVAEEFFIELINSILSCPGKIIRHNFSIYDAPDNNSVVFQYR